MANIGAFGHPGGPAIGTVEVTDGTVTVVRADGSSETLQPGDAVYEGDTVGTAGDGTVQIVMADEGIFTLGPDGEMVMDSFVYDPDAQDGEAVVSVLEGVFVFVSGQIAKTGVDAMAINTPTATIGIRGTKIVGDAGDGDTPTTVTLLEEVGGHVGEIFVENEAGIQVLNRVNQTTTVADATSAPDTPFILDAAEVGRVFEGAHGIETGTLVDPETGRPRRHGVRPADQAPADNDIDALAEDVDDLAALQTDAGTEQPVEMLDDTIDALDGDSADLPAELIAQLTPLLDRLRALLGDAADGLNDDAVLRLAVQELSHADGDGRDALLAGLGDGTLGGLSLFGLDAALEADNEFDTKEQRAAEVAGDFTYDIADGETVAEGDLTVTKTADAGANDGGVTTWDGGATFDAANAGDGGTIDAAYTGITVDRIDGSHTLTVSYADTARQEYEAMLDVQGMTVEAAAAGDWNTVRTLMSATEQSWDNLDGLRDAALADGDAETIETYQPLFQKVREEWDALKSEVQERYTAETGDDPEWLVNRETPYEDGGFLAGLDADLDAIAETAEFAENTVVHAYQWDDAVHVTWEQQQDPVTAPAPLYETAVDGHDPGHADPGAFNIDALIGDEPALFQDDTASDAGYTVVAGDTGDEGDGNAESHQEVHAPDGGVAYSSTAGADAPAVGDADFTS